MGLVEVSVGTVAARAMARGAATTGRGMMVVVVVVSRHWRYPGKALAKGLSFDEGFVSGFSGFRL